jgi:uncharacterized protein (TIGR00730 family)
VTKRIRSSLTMCSVLDRPRSRWKELHFALKAFYELIRGLRTFHFLGPCVTVFGSARIQPGAPYYRLAEQMGAEMVRMGFCVITGGGPGIMEAANKGAFEAGGVSVGCNIRLPSEQMANDYLHRNVDMKFFFIRKVLLVKYSYAFIIMPGGMGTLDELFETLTLIQTGTIKGFPVVLMGMEYWKNLLVLMDDLAKAGTIDRADLGLVLATDEPEAACAHIHKHAIERFKLRERRKRLWLLAE